MNPKNYYPEIQKAVTRFWEIRTAQGDAGKDRDFGNRSAVTAGKQLDGFINLFIDIALDSGIDPGWIYTKSTGLPGYFRPMKNWDLIVVTEEKNLLAVLELKSQVGSFGNNFNNRAEEAIGSAVDLWTAYREKGFGDQLAPWLGFMILVEESSKSTKPVKIKSGQFEEREEFRDTSYLQRYDLLCSKMVMERHYSAASVIQTQSDGRWGNIRELTSIESMLRSFAGHLNTIRK